jgi:hypothetical protein
MSSGSSRQTPLFLLCWVSFELWSQRETDNGQESNYEVMEVMELQQIDI